MYKISIIFSLVCLISHQVLSGVPVKNCEGVTTKGTLVEVLVNGGDECTLKKGTNVTVTVEFTPKEDVKELKVVVHGIVNGKPVHVPVPDANLCKNSGLTCPLKSGQTYTIKKSAMIKTIYPSVKVQVKVEDQDEKGNDVLCYYLDCEIVS